MRTDKTNKVLLYAYLDISHALMFIEGDSCEADPKALKATLEDIREAYTGNPNDLKHEREEVER